MFDIFLVFAQNIDCGFTLEPPRRGGYNKYPQSMFWIKNKKKGIPCIPQFYCIRVGYKGVFIARTCFPDDLYFQRLSKVAVLFYTFNLSMKFR